MFAIDQTPRIRTGLPANDSRIGLLAGPGETCGPLPSRAHGRRLRRRRRLMARLG